LENAVGVKDTNVTVAGAGHIIFLSRILQSVSDVELASQVLYVEGRVACGKRRVCKSTGQCGGSEILIEHVNLSRMKIGRIEKVRRAVIANRQTFIDSIGRRDFRDSHCSRSPCRDCPCYGRKD